MNATPTLRHYVRCLACLFVAAIHERPGKAWTCGICGGDLEDLGPAKADRNLAPDFLCKCDERCTMARGPKCDCSCRGANHGAGFDGLVMVARADAVPPKVVVTDPEEAQDALAKVQRWRLSSGALNRRLRNMAEAIRAGRTELPDADYFAEAELLLIARKLSPSGWPKTWDARAKLIIKAEKAAEASGNRR